MTQRPDGFTLLEMVVAIGIFAIIAAISYAALNNFLDAREHLNDRRVEIQGLQTAMVLMERDLRYAVDRSVRNEFGDSEPAFTGGRDDRLQEGGEFLRMTTAKPSTETGGGQRLERVAWRLNDGKLTRVTWRVLDRYLDSKTYERVLLENVENVDVFFYSFEEGDESATKDLWLGDNRLPVGVELILSVDGRAAYRRVLQVAGS